MEGYDSSFLGSNFEVPLPEFSDALRPDVYEYEGEPYTSYVHFSIATNRERRQPIVVALNVDQRKFQNVSDRGNWRLDAKVGEYQLDNSYYRNNPINRGHLAGRATAAWGENMKEAQAASDATNIYSNSSLQHSRFNQGEWLVLEDWVKDLKCDATDKISVFSGPIYTSKSGLNVVVGKPMAVIPTAFFKVVCFVDKEGKLATRAFIVPQDYDALSPKNAKDNLDLGTYQVPCRLIEEETGLLFDEAVKDANPMRYDGEKPQILPVDGIDIRNKPGPPIEASPFVGVELQTALVNPEGANTGMEFTVVVNYSDKAVDLGGWLVSLRGEKTVLPSGLLGVGETRKFSEINGLKWRNKGGTISLLDPQNRVAHRVKYSREEAFHGIGFSESNRRSPAPFKLRDNSNHGQKLGANSSSPSLFTGLKEIIRQTLEKMYTGRELEIFQEIPLSQYLSLQHGYQKFLDVLNFDDESDVQIALNSLDPKHWKVHLPSDSCRCLTMKSHDGQDFLILIDDFFLAFDDNTQEVCVFVPGSRALQFESAAMMKSPNFFDGLSIQQVYFLARRFVQLTGAQWKYSCFAEIENDLLPNSSMLRSVAPSVFSNVRIDLFPMSFDCLSCVDEVGLLNIEDERDELHCVGVKLFGEVIGFERGKDGISQPCILRDANRNLEANDEFIDLYDLIIGGDHFEVHPDGESTSRVIEQRRRRVLNVDEQASNISSSDNFGASNRTPHVAVQTQFFPNSKDTESNDDDLHSGNVSIEYDSSVQLIITERRTKFDFMFEARSKLQFVRDGYNPVFNLAFFPQNKMFGECIKKEYTRRNLKELENDFRSLGYGKQFARELSRRAATILGYSRGRTTTLAEVQDSLLNEWVSWRSENMHAFSLFTAFHRFVPTTQHILIFQKGILHVAKGTRNLTRSATIGGISSLKPQFTLVRSPLTTDTAVSNIFGAAVDVSGLPYKFGEFPRGRGKKVSRQGMIDLLGAITLLCVLLRDKVLPSGRFRHCIQVRSDDKHAIRQKVEFNVPLPIGVFLSALYFENTQVCMLADRRWNDKWNYSAPVFTGVDENDEALEEIVCCSFE